LDWSSLTESKSSQIRKLKEDLAVLEGKMKILNKGLDGLLELSKVAKNIPELAAKVQGIEAERQSLRSSANQLKTEIKGIEGFLEIDAGNLIRGLAKGNTFASRNSLRLAIRQNIQQIELFQQAPKEFKGNTKAELGRCIKIIFANGAERWIFPKLDVRVDGKKMPTTPVKNQDALGTALVDMLSVNMKAARTTGKYSQWKKEKGKL